GLTALASSSTVPFLWYSGSWNCSQKVVSHSACLGMMLNERIDSAALSSTGAESFLPGTLAAITSAVASDLRGASTFQWWMPSVSATIALVAISGFLVA